MNNAPHAQDPTQLTTSRTELTPEERRRGGATRKLALVVLATIAVAACLVVPYSWYMWAVTANACIDTFFRGQPLRLGSGASTWQEQFTALDISSFSALILALLFTRLAYVGCRSITLWMKRDGGSFFDHAHNTVLFSEGFDTLSIRLGLLGTLLSFLLGALTQMSDGNVASAAPSVGTLQAEVDQVMNAEDAASRRQVAASAADSSADDLSSKMFLILCASLVSTFVGTGVAYVITPSLNWLNDRAAGRHQISDSDAEFVTEEFFRQIGRTSQRLSEFEAITRELSARAEHVSSFEQSMGQASENLAKLLVSLQEATATFEVASRNGHELAQRLAAMEAQNEKLRDLVERVIGRLGEPFDSISRTSTRFKDAAQSGELAFRELKSAAGTASDSLKETTQRSKVSWKLLHEIRDSMADLARSERAQTAEASRLVQGFEELGSALNQLLDQMAALGYVPQHQQAVHQASHDGDGDGDGHAVHTRQSSTHSVTPRGAPAHSGHATRHRSWWRRWLG